jgi:ABC-type Fe3+ transport system permease subunit
MSFTPLTGGFSSSLSGAVEPTKFLLTGDEARDDLYSRRIHPPEEKAESIRYTVLIVIISAILFVTVVALYDVLRNIAVNYFADRALTDPRSGNTQQDIERTNIANENTLLASIVFALICVVTAACFIGYLVRQHVKS